MKTILLIDDDAVFLQSLSSLMVQKGYEVATAQTHESALENARFQQPDWILLDLKIPGTSGLKLIPELLAVNPDFHIVVLTGYANIATAVEAIKLGARYYLAKPVGFQEIMEAFHKNEGNTSIPIDDGPTRLDMVEWAHIQAVLEKNGGNISAAARELKMHRRTLQRKLQKRPPTG